MIRELAKRFIYCVKAKREDQILDKVSDSDVVSFDVFDTLLKRDVSEPRDVFTLIEKKLSAEGPVHTGFAGLRIEAERQARALHAGRDITLNEIYGQLPLPQDRREKLMEMERAMEMAVSVPNIPMKRVYDACVRQGKRILFISDMYLPAECVQELLQKNGYGRGKLYVSSESGFTKHSGRLFRYVRECEKIEGERWTHIGDSISSDYYAPRREGIHAVLINPKRPRSTYIDRKTFKSNAGYRQLCHFIGTRIDRYEDPYERIGYAVLGPLLYGFVRWLEETVPKDELLVFLARDGLVIQQAFEVISSRPSIYFYVSRKSVRTPYISKVDSADGLMKTGSGMRKYSMKELFSLYGLSDEESEDIFRLNHMDSDLIVSGDVSEKEAMRAIWPVIHGKSHQQYEYLQQYLNQLCAALRCAIVDIGWGGTIQTLLAKCGFLSGEEEIRWSGYYYGSFGDGDKAFYEGQKRKNYLFEGRRNSRIQDAIRYSRSFFEMLFLATHGTTKCYQKIENGTIEPVFGEPDDKGKTACLKECMHSSAVDFVRDMSKSPLDGFTILDPQAIAGNYLGFAAVPDLTTIKMFEDFDYELERKFKFGAAHGLGYYCLHMKQFVSEFCDSPCKAWFLKSVLKIPLPYIWILSCLKSVSANEKRANV